MQRNSTIGELMERKRIQDGAKEYQGHTYMDLARFDDATKHMIIFDVLTDESPVGWKGERNRLYLSDVGYQKALDNQKAGNIKIISHPETGETTTEEEDYEYYILNVKLRNKGLNSVISNSGLSEDDMERYRILLQTRGNRPDIFGNDIYATPGGEYTDYDIPGEALTDTRFANMIREAEKYLGYPYVWGGSSPSTSFDCSGFVSYVINHCGNGWSVGRLTANGLMGVCDIIPKSSAKPGDLIFFQGTYDTSGASHVGIYVGNGMMIHCGNPISYASIESNYWQQHFYCFGRIRN